MSDTLNLDLFFETLARIISQREENRGVEITVKSIRRKDATDGEAKV